MRRKSDELLKLQPVPHDKKKARDLSLHYTRSYFSVVHGENDINRLTLNVAYLFATVSKNFTSNNITLPVTFFITKKLFEKKSFNKFWVTQKLHIYLSNPKVTHQQ